MSVVAYARVSTEHRQFSISDQMRVIRKYAKRRGLVIVKAYADELKGGGTP